MARILYVFNELQYSGAELMYIQAAPILLQQGHQLFAMATFPQKGRCVSEFEKAGFTVDQIVLDISSNPLSIWQSANKLIKYIKENKIDIVHCQSNARFMSCAIAAKRCGIRSIHSINNLFSCSAKWKIPLQRFVRWFASHYLGMRFHSGSDTVYQNELDYFHNKTERVYWWFIDSDYTPAVEGEKEKVRKEIGVPEDAFVLMTAGGCNYQKHHSEIVRATKILADKIPNFIFMHLGKGGLEDEEKQLAKELGVSRNIMWCGNQSDFRKYLIAADVYTMTSRYEGLSNATIMALACQIPAVLYHVCGLWDYNLNGENTIQVDTNPKALADGVMKLYNDQKLRSELKEKGRKLVLSKYKASTNIAQLGKTFYS